MTKLARMLVLIMAVSFLFVMVTTADQKVDETVKCPVSGKEMKKAEVKVTHEVEGKTYYFCCENCKEAFLKDPEKYTHLGSHEGCGHACSLEQDAAVDPVCGMKVKKSEAKATYEHDGKTYYFCMEECKEKFVKSPEKYAKADGDHVTCPVSGEELSKSEAAGSFEYNGKTYYFCCEGCKEKFVKDPDKYVKK